MEDDGLNQNTNYFPTTNTHNSPPTGMYMRTQQQGKADSLRFGEAVHVARRKTACLCLKEYLLGIPSNFQRTRFYESVKHLQHLASTETSLKTPKKKKAKGGQTNGKGKVMKVAAEMLQSPKMCMGLLCAITLSQSLITSVPKPSESSQISP